MQPRFRPAQSGLHVIKYDGYRPRVERDGDRVRLITRGGYDWTKRYPWIVEAARKVRQKRFVLDDEAVILGVTARKTTGTSRSGQIDTRLPGACGAHGLQHRHR